MTRVPAPTGDRAALGAYGEVLAAQHLRALGMVLLDHNWRCPAGELDLVLRDGSAVVFCEVKTRRSSAYGSPLEAVTAHKAARLRRLAARWLEAHDVRPREVRIDLVGIVCPRSGPPVLDHVAGVC
ncbi:YraN family protein [Nocardioides donggukensis]|uniref:UPF0102 protein IE331_05355 n=1 Tax=Nocardioides donggukensis TaxID=2774019 RepID=A0A927K3M5_9ACTN|nr:YraN family protein [Nocardioides donggukensis]MBD8869043.1 YraN family protein [Nocardioides donggukensis]